MPSHTLPVAKAVPGTVASACTCAAAHHRRRRPRRTRAGAGRAKTGRANTGRALAMDAGAGRSGPGQDRPGWANTGRAGPDQALAMDPDGPGKAGSNRTSAYRPCHPNLEARPARTCAVSFIPRRRSGDARPGAGGRERRPHRPPSLVSRPIQPATPPSLPRGWDEGLAGGRGLGVGVGGGIEKG